MPDMGRYCKAYLAERFREYSGWEENLQNLRTVKKTEGREEVEIQRLSIEDKDVLYLQENYVVTDDIFKNEHIIFEKVDDDWKTFCTDVLQFDIPHFDIPTDETLETKPKDEASEEKSS